MKASQKVENIIQTSFFLKPFQIFFVFFCSINYANFSRAPTKEWRMKRENKHCKRTEIFCFSPFFSEVFTRNWKKSFSFISLNYNWVNEWMSYNNNEEFYFFFKTINKNVCLFHMQFIINYCCDIDGNKHKVWVWGMLDDFNSFMNH